MKMTEQGFHEICSVFLLASGEDGTDEIVETVDRFAKDCLRY